MQTSSWPKKKLPKKYPRRVTCSSFVSHEKKRNHSKTVNCPGSRRSAKKRPMIYCRPKSPGKKWPILNVPEQFSNYFRTLKSWRMAKRRTLLSHVLEVDFRRVVKGPGSFFRRWFMVYLPSLFMATTGAYRIPGHGFLVP